MENKTEDGIMAEVDQEAGKKIAGDLPNRFIAEVVVFYKEAWNVFKSRFVTLVAINLIPVILLFLAFTLVIFFQQIIDPPALFESSRMRFGTELPAFVYLSLIPLLIFFVILYVASWSAVALVEAAGARTVMSIREAYAKARTKVGSYWWVVMLMGVIICGSFIFLIIPSIIFSVFFVLSVWVFVFEGKKGMDALVGSREYVVGRWWKTLGHIGAVLIFPAIASVMTGILDGLGLSLIARLLQIFVQFFYPAFTVCYIGVLYYFYSVTQASNMRGASSVSAPDRTAFWKNPKFGYLAVGILGALIGVFLAYLFIVNVLPILLALSSFRS